jgi:hypothetical protein
MVKVPGLENFNFELRTVPMKNMSQNRPDTQSVEPE